MRLGLQQITIYRYQCYRAMHISTHTTFICFYILLGKKILSLQNRIRVSPCPQISSWNNIRIHRKSCGSGCMGWRVRSPHISDTHI